MIRLCAGLAAGTDTLWDHRLGVTPPAEDVARHNASIFFED